MENNSYFAHDTHKYRYRQNNTAPIIKHGRIEGAGGLCSLYQLKLILLTLLTETL